jgi:hypothetical protein
MIFIHTRSSLFHSTNNVFDAPNMLRLIIHGFTHQRRFFFFLKCVDIILSNSHILQHLPAQVHLPPFWNRLPRSLLRLYNQCRNMAASDGVVRDSVISVSDGGGRLMSRK